MEGYELIPALIELIDEEYLEWWECEYERIVLHCDKELEFIDELHKEE